MPIWPSQSNADRFYGDPRGVGDEPDYNWADQQLIAIVPPWAMIDDDHGHVVEHFLMHAKCADSLNAILQQIWSLYGTYANKQPAIEAIGLHRFSGSWVYRSKRHGNTLSMHSYGCAFDLNANAMPMGSTKSWPANVVSAFEDRGWTWGGRWSGASRDAMHWQACNVD
jgi:hypothetical protein